MFRVDRLIILPEKMVVNQEIYLWIIKKEHGFETQIMTFINTLCGAFSQEKLSQGLLLNYDKQSIDYHNKLGGLLGG